MLLITSPKRGELNWELWSLEQMRRDGFLANCSTSMVLGLIQRDLWLEGRWALGNGEGRWDLRDIWRSTCCHFDPLPKSGCKANNSSVAFHKLFTALLSLLHGDPWQRGRVKQEWEIFSGHSRLHRNLAFSQEALTGKALRGSVWVVSSVTVT